MDKTVTVIRHLGNSPMANAARMNVAAISLCGIAIRDMPFTPREEAYQTVYYHANPGELDINYEAVKRIAYWTWEVSNFLPFCWKEEAEKYDQIWVPSFFVRDSLFRAGIPLQRIKIIPCFATFGRLLAVPKGDTRFITVVTGSSMLDRENPWLVAQAFRQAFSSGESNVSLTVKASNLSMDDREEFRSFCGSDRRITLVEGDMDEVETVNLLSRHTAYVSLHKSISFGSVILNCMSIGLPVIASMSGGNKEFCTADNCLPVFCHRVPALNRGFSGGEWGSPDLEDAAQKMRELHLTKNSIGVRNMVQTAYANTLNKYNFLSTVTAVKQATLELFS